MKISDLGQGEERYLYRDTNTWHISRDTGDQLIVFSNGQEELRHQDGSLTVTFPDGTVKTVEREGQETVQFTDGTIITLRRGSMIFLSQRFEFYKATKLVSAVTSSCQIEI